MELHSNNYSIKPMCRKEYVIRVSNIDLPTHTLIDDRIVKYSTTKIPISLCYMCLITVYYDVWRACTSRYSEHSYCN